MTSFIKPNWPAPSHIKAVSSTRIGGYSTQEYQGLNLGNHVNDSPEIVAKNRAFIAELAQMPSAPVWLNQTHSTDVVELFEPTSQIINADASITKQPNLVCCVMTADCLPVLLTNKSGTQVAAVHAGWRGLLDGIVESVVKSFDKNSSEDELMAWIGPAIGANAFEVGQEVKEQFVAHSSQASSAFVSVKNTEHKYLADMNQLVTQRLHSVGVTDIYYSNLCTFEDKERFYSYRRDGVTGRQASFIWIDPLRI